MKGNEREWNKSSESGDYMIPLIPNRTYKDTIFNLLFQQKVEALSLYNAIRGTKFTDPEALRIVTLDTGIYLSYKNDVAFMIGDELNLYEQQSTEDPNLPLRGLIYFAAEYQRIIQDEKLNIYGTKLLQLPIPRYVILCNAESMQEERKILKLSDSFRRDNRQTQNPEQGQNLPQGPSLECIAEVVNINAGHNQKIMDGCRTLSEYATLIRYVREYKKQGHAWETAITFAVERCIRENVLQEFLISNKEKVIGMIFDEYDENEQRKMDRRDAKAEGKAEALIEFLNILGSVPDDLHTVITSETSLDKLNAWLSTAYRSKTLDEFREKANI